LEIAVAQVIAQDIDNVRLLRSGRQRRAKKCKGRNHHAIHGAITPTESLSFGRLLLQTGTATEIMQVSIFVGRVVAARPAAAIDKVTTRVIIAVTTAVVSRASMAHITISDAEWLVMRIIWRLGR